MSLRLHPRAAAIVRIAAACLACAFATAAPARIYPGASAPRVATLQRLGALLPLDAPFVDASGRAVRLADYFRADASHEAVPVVLVLGYYRCQNLCETEMEGVIQALADSGLSRRTYRVLAVSIDAEETAIDAAARRRIDLQVADLASPRSAAAADGPLVLDTLVGGAASIERLTRQAGFVFVRSGTDRPSSGATDTEARAFAHAAGFLVATPDGRVSRYFLGVRHDPAALRRAIADAAGDGIGSAVASLLLLCAHLDPTLGHFSAAVMFGLRLLGVGLAVLLGLWIWRHRRAPALGPRP
jgi:protein SCO1/2